MLADGDEIAVLPPVSGGAVPADCARPSTGRVGTVCEIVRDRFSQTLVAFSLLVRISVRSSLLRRALGAIVALLLLVLPRTAQAADPLAVAQARVTDAIKAADKTVGDLKDAEAEYFRLEQQIADERPRDRSAARRRSNASRSSRACVPWLPTRVARGSSTTSSVATATSWTRRGGQRCWIGSTRRGNEAIDQLAGITSELHRRDTSLRNAITRQQKALRDLKEREARTTRAVDEAQRAEQALRARLVAEKRASEYAARRRASARRRSSRSAAIRVAAEVRARSSWEARGSVPCRARCRSETTSVTPEAEAARTRATTCSPPLVRRSSR